MFACSAGTGTTRKLPAGGTYPARAELTAINGIAIAEVPAAEVMVESCGLTTLQPDTPYWQLALWQVIVGAGSGLFNSPNTSAVWRFAWAMPGCSASRR